MRSGRLDTWRGIQGGSQSAGDVEVDLVGVDQWPDARKVAVAGSIRWRERTPVRPAGPWSARRTTARVPGAASAALIAVCRAGCTAQDVDRAYGPSDLVSAWAGAGS